MGAKYIWHNVPQSTYTATAMTSRAARPPAADTLHARKRQVVQEAIWNAAIDLFAENGYDRTTIEQIVHAAGVSQRSFFRYFSSKSDLMSHAMTAYGDAVVAAIEACPRGAPPLEILGQTVRQVAEGAAAHPTTRKTMAVLSKYPAARAAEVSRLPELQDRVVQAFATRCRKDRGGDLLPQLLAGMTLQLIGVTLQSWFTHPRRDVRATADEAIALARGLMCGKEPR